MCYQSANAVIKIIFLVTYFDFHKLLISNSDLYSGIRTDITTLLKLSLLHFIHQVALARRQRRDLYGLRVKLPAAHLSITLGGSSTPSLLLLNVKQGRKLLTPSFIVFGLTRLEIEPVFTISAADGLSTDH